jgi:hypothetical protein
MGLRKNVLDAMLGAINATGATGTPFTRKQLISVITTVGDQAEADSWIVVSDTAGSRRWRKAEATIKWYIAETGPYLIVLYVSQSIRALHVYLAPTSAPDDPRSPMDGAIYSRTESVADDVSTNVLAWTFIDSRIAAGVA